MNYCCFNRTTVSYLEMPKILLLLLPCCGMLFRVRCLNDNCYYRTMDCGTGGSVGLWLHMHASVGLPVMVSCSGSGVTSLV